MTQAANYITMQNSAFSNSDVRSFLRFKLNVDYSQKGIIEFMKKTLGLSYKKWSTRPTIKDYYRINALKTLFWIAFVNIVDNFWILVSIDEVCFSRITRLNYFWVWGWELFCKQYFICRISFFDLSNNHILSVVCKPFRLY